MSQILLDQAIANGFDLSKISLVSLREDEKRAVEFFIVNNCQTKIMEFGSVRFGGNFQTANELSPNDQNSSARMINHSEPPPPDEIASELSLRMINAK